MSNEIKGAEIFDTGTWNGIPFSSEDLDDIISAFDGLKLGGRVPLKFGHKGKDTRMDDTQPALGWVSKIYRKGSKLVADITDVPTVVYDSIRKGLYKFVSVELLKNVPAGTRKIPWVLDAVALLGATSPAVGTLSGLQALTYARDTGLQYDGVVAFSRESETNFSKERSNMGDNNISITELAERVAQLTVELKDTRDENQRLKQDNVKFSAVKSQLDALQDNVKKDRIARHRQMLTDTLEAAIRDNQCLPAVREKFARAYRLADDDVVETLTTQDVVDFVKLNPHPNPPKKKDSTRAVFSLDDPNGEVPAGTTPDNECLLRARANLARKGKHEPSDLELQNEIVSIFRVNPELGERWKFQLDQAN